VRRVVELTGQRRRSAKDKDRVRVATRGDHVERVVLSGFAKVGVLKVKAVARSSTQRVIEELLFQRGNSPLVHARDENRNAADDLGVFTLLVH
jgi:hypothetical protein